MASVVAVTVNRSSTSNRPSLRPWAFISTPRSMAGLASMRRESGALGFSNDRSRTYWAKKVGRQPEEDARAQPAGAAPAAEAGAAARPGAPGALDAVTLASIAGLRARDPNFDPVRFLEGARQAQETIVRAYASGDRETLKPLLTPHVTRLEDLAVTDSIPNVERSERWHLWQRSQ